MNKKTYDKPSMKVAQIENDDLICQSTFSLNDEEVTDWESEETKPEGWGRQW